MSKKMWIYTDETTAAAIATAAEKTTTNNSLSKWLKVHIRLHVTEHCTYGL